MSRWSEPKIVSRTRAGYALHLGAEERAVVAGLLGEMRDLLTGGDSDAPGLARLFPVVHPDDAEQEAEYQRLMRDELIESRVGAIDRVRTVLDEGGRKVSFDEAGLLSLMQAINGVRLVLGAMLDIADDDDELADEAADDRPEMHLYAFLSWMLDACVRAASDPD